MIGHKYRNEFTRVTDKVPVSLPCAPAIDATPATATPTARNPFCIKTRQDQNHKVAVIPKRRAVDMCTAQESRSLPWVCPSSTTAGLREKKSDLTCPWLNSRDTHPYDHNPVLHHPTLTYRQSVSLGWEWRRQNVLEKFSWRRPRAKPNGNGSTQMYVICTQEQRWSSKYCFLTVHAAASLRKFYWIQSPWKFQTMHNYWSLLSIKISATHNIRLRHGWSFYICGIYVYW